MGVTSNIENWKLAVIVFNKLIQEGTIYSIMNNMPEVLDYSSHVGSGRMAIIEKTYFEFCPEVKLKRFWNPFTSAYATTYTGNYKYIGLNRKKLNRSVASICGSIAHEWGHCLEYYISNNVRNFELNHGDNNPVGKDNTFQYILGRAVKRHVQDTNYGLI